MHPIDRNDAIRRVTEAIGAVELEEARRRIGSATLRAALRLILRHAEEGKAELFIPHYWAVYYHDGRGSISPVSATKLVFFANPKNDPRRPHGPVERYAEERRLTKAEYLAGLRENEARAAGLGPYMFVVDAVGPAAPHPFFTEMTTGADARVEDEALQAFGGAMQDWIKTDPVLRPGEDDFAEGVL